MIVAAFGPPAGKHGLSGNNQAVGQFLDFTAQSGDALGYGFQPVAFLDSQPGCPGDGSDAGTKGRCDRQDGDQVGNLRSVDGRNRPQGPGRDPEPLRLPAELSPEPLKQGEGLTVPLCGVLLQAPQKNGGTLRLGQRAGGQEKSRFGFRAPASRFPQA